MAESTARISQIDPETAPEEVKAVIRAHLAEGYHLTNEKRTLLHNITAFKAIEENSYELDRVLQKLIGKQAGDFFEYAVSLENDCIVCTTYFHELLKRNGIDYEHFSFSEKEKLLIEYGRQLAKNPKEISDELFARMKANFTEEEIVVITAMGTLMIANNIINDALRIEV